MNNYIMLNAITKVTGISNFNNLRDILLFKYNAVSTKSMMAEILNSCGKMNYNYQKDKRVYWVINEERREGLEFLLIGKSELKFQRIIYVDREVGRFNLEPIENITKKIKVANFREFQDDFREKLGVKISGKILRIYLKKRLRDANKDNEILIIKVRDLDGTTVSFNVAYTPEERIKYKYLGDKKI